MSSFLSSEESKWDIECKSDKFGLKYRGYINESSEGLPCLKWVDVINQTNLEAALLNLNSTLRFDALNETAETAENYCRNPIHKDMTEPICFVDIVPNDAFEGVGNCNVPDCPEGTGLCLNKSWVFPLNHTSTLLLVKLQHMQ